MYFKGQKKDVHDKTLFHPVNMQSVQVLVSPALTWLDIIKPIFVYNIGVNSQKCMTLEKRTIFCSNQILSLAAIDFTSEMMQLLTPGI